jgi:hypothetical protein
MSYEVKMGYISGFNLVFSAYQPDGNGRGIEQQPLPELRTGYYGATPLTDLVAGDEVIACLLEFVYWENAQLYILTDDYVYYEDARVAYEEVWVTTSDIQINDPVTSVGAVVGANEYAVAADYFTSIQDDINDIITDERTVNNIYDETGVTSKGQPRQLIVSTVGYVKTEMQEI